LGIVRRLGILFSVSTLVSIDVGVPFFWRFWFRFWISILLWGFCSFCSLFPLLRRSFKVCKWRLSFLE
jgi:hypothetical protein